jgi:CheY-like chemotaxis protein
MPISHQDTAPRRRLLIVEDHTNLRRLWAEMLRLNGYDADTAANGLEALHKIGRHTYDAIICDVHMPVLNGREMFDACQLQFPEAANRVIFITGAWYADSEEICKETGRPYLLKSFAWQNLHSAIQQVFDANRAAVAEPK